MTKFIINKAEIDVKFSRRLTKVGFKDRNDYHSSDDIRYSQNNCNTASFGFIFRWISKRSHTKTDRCWTSVSTPEVQKVWTWLTRNLIVNTYNHVNIWLPTNAIWNNVNILSISFPSKLWIRPNGCIILQYTTKDFVENITHCRVKERHLCKYNIENDILMQIYWHKFWQCINWKTPVNQISENIQFDNQVRQHTLKM